MRYPDMYFFLFVKSLLVKETAKWVKIMRRTPKLIDPWNGSFFLQMVKDDDNDKKAKQPVVYCEAPSIYPLSAISVSQPP